MLFFCFHVIFMILYVKMNDLIILVSIHTNVKDNFLENVLPQTLLLIKNK